MNDAPTVFLVDDDALVRDALTRLFTASGMTVEAYGRAEEFLESYRGGRPGCLLLDLQMPAMSGLELQALLRERAVMLPVVFLTAYGDVPTTVRAFKGGAVDLLEKPVEGGAVLASVRRALRIDAEHRHKQTAHDEIRRRCSSLTSRERELVPLIVAGRSCKDIARTLGISHRTVELHRARILRKLGAKSLLELATMVQAVGLQAGTSPPSDAVSPP